MKKIYNQPITEVAIVNTEQMMQAPVISGAGNASGDPSNIYDGD